MCDGDMGTKSEIVLRFLIVKNAGGSCELHNSPDFTEHVDLHNTLPEI